MARNSSTVVELIPAIVAWVNAQAVPCFYTGIRVDCAMALGVAPNNPVFHAAWDSPAWDVSPADYARDYMFAYISEM